MMHWRSELLLLLTSGLVLAGSMACGEDYPRGELMVVVTTDMAVPHDIDTLRWTVILPGQSRPFRTDSVSLTEVGLPATLAVASGRRTTDPVVIEVEGLVGGADGRSRIRRSAEVRVPTDGVKSLPMPLNWLCSEANLRTPCDSDETCQAGQCRDRSVDESSLLDYEEEAAPSCFNVSDCFRPYTWVVSHPNPNSVAPTRCAIVDDPRVAAAPDINLALMVDTQAVGNYGVCGIADSCLIPLAHDSEDGWDVLVQDGQTVAILLPDKVCDDGTPVDGVAIELADNGGCSVKEPAASLCPEDSTCLAGAVCPSGWENLGWTGYSCSASQAPDIEEAPTACLRLGAEDPSDSVPGHWCCTEGQDLPEGGDELLIDDMSLGSQIQIQPPNADAGFWWTATDDVSAPIYPRPHELFTYREFAPPAPTEGGPEIIHAACLRSEGFQGTFAIMGFHFAVHIGTTDLVPFDVSGYSGISFWTRTFMNVPPQQAIAVRVSDINTDASYPESACNRDSDLGQCGDDFGRRGILLNDETWQQEFVRWDELTQDPNESWGGARFDEGFQSEHAISVMFAVDARDVEGVSPPFDFCVADIRFTTD